MYTKGTRAYMGTLSLRHTHTRVKWTNYTQRIWMHAVKIMINDKSVIESVLLSLPQLSSYSPAGWICPEPLVETLCSSFFHHFFFLPPPPLNLLLRPHPHPPFSDFPYEALSSQLLLRFFSVISVEQLALSVTYDSSQPFAISPWPPSLQIPC